MTTSQVQPAVAMTHHHIWNWRVFVWVAAISLVVTIVGAAIVLRRPRVDPQVLWNQAQNALKSGDLAGAQAMLASIGRLRAPTEFDWSLKAQIDVACDRPDEALSALSLIADSDRLAAQAALLAGRIERQRNRLRPAEVHFRKAIARDPLLTDAHKELIYILGMQLRRREVDSEFKALARLTPLTHQELFTWGLTHFNFLYNVWAQDTAEHLESFILADPLDRYSRLSLATLIMKSPGAEPQVERILAPLPRSDPEAVALLIEMKFDHGHFDEAIAKLEETRADHANLARIRGRVALRRGDLTAAIKYFQQALTEEPYDRVSVSEFGKALALKGEKSAAESYLARARRLDAFFDLLVRIRRPDRENEQSDLAQLGRACEAAGLHIEARGWFLLAIDRNPFDAEAQQALKRLEKSATFSENPQSEVAPHLSVKG